jgi:hypothetical protein
MNSFPSSLAVAVVAAALAFSAPAQQAIIFSKPAGDVTEKANSFMESPSKLRGAAGSFNAPSSLFGNQAAGSFDVLPGWQPPAAVSPAEAQHWQKVFEAKKKWTLMTPEEILGLPTAEKLLGLPDPKNDPKLTIEERYILRQNDGMSGSATNGRPNAALLREDSPDNPFRTPGENQRRFISGDKPEPGSTKYFNQFLNATPASPFDLAPKAESRWTSPFDRPAPAPKPDLAREAAMERFRALMEPAPPPDNPALAARLAPLPVVDPNLQVLPPVNPAGRSFTPIQSGISKPTGIMPLPSISSPYELPTTPKPAWQAQPPPWLSDSPQPFGAVRQRVF